MPRSDSPTTDADGESLIRKLGVARPRSSTAGPVATVTVMTSPDEFTGPTTELLQALIRNECVNDGTPDSGEETRNADLLVQYLEGGGLDVEQLHPSAGA